mmetsp:Transcript_17206/g.59372  ORF Transcript_17206/g.59372 Transcript_17206/m.59372 type:complete len:224 (-) Transcript_17206:1011-1682(-)
MNLASGSKWQSRFMGKLSQSSCSPGGTACGRPQHVDTSASSFCRAWYMDAASVAFFLTMLCSSPGSRSRSKRKRRILCLCFSRFASFFASFFSFFFSFFELPRARRPSASETMFFLTRSTMTTSLWRPRRSAPLKSRTGRRDTSRLWSSSRSSSADSGRSPLSTGHRSRPSSAFRGAKVPAGSARPTSVGSQSTFAATALRSTAPRRRPPPTTKAGTRMPPSQ